MSQRVYKYPCNYIIGPHVMFHVSRSYSTSVASSSKSSHSRPLRSPVWDNFEVVGEKKVRYKLCVPPATTTLAYHGGTTSMQSHMLSHHPDEYGESSKESQSQRKLDSFVHAKKCAEEITSRIAEMVARDLWPISIFKGAGFKHLLSYLERSFAYTHNHSMLLPLQRAEEEAQERNYWLWTFS